MCIEETLVPSYLYFCVSFTTLLAHPCNIQFHHTFISVPFYFILITSKSSTVPSYLYFCAFLLNLTLTISCFAFHHTFISVPFYFIVFIRYSGFSSIIPLFLCLFTKIYSSFLLYSICILPCILQVYRGI